MTHTATYSTLLLTLLMVVGLFFFIRASTKDRLETLVMEPSTDPVDLLQELTTYFEGRAYRIAAADAASQRVILRGQVRSSWFLAVFLTLLAAVGALCFALVLAYLWPQYGAWFLVLLGIAPAAGWFYWRGSSRDEDIVLELQPSATSEPATDGGTAVAVTAHRDELITLGQYFSAKAKG